MMAKGDDYFFSQHLIYAGNILLFKCQGLHDLMHRFIRVTVLSLPKYFFLITIGSSALKKSTICF